VVNIRTSHCEKICSNEGQRNTVKPTYSNHYCDAPHSDTSGAPGAQENSGGILGGIQRIIEQDWRFRIAQLCEVGAGWQQEEGWGCRKPLSNRLRNYTRQFYRVQIGAIQRRNGGALESGVNDAATDFLCLDNFGSGIIIAAQD
jgi:hypothetical protein